MNKIIIVCLFIANLMGLDYIFSLENNSINIKRNQNIDITFNEQALKLDDGDFLDINWTKNSLYISENNASGKKIDFDVDIIYGSYTTISLSPINMKSKFKYFLNVNGAMFKNKVDVIASDKNISFTTDDFLDIVLRKEVNITLNSTINIPISLSESPVNDLIINISSNDKNITILTQSITLSSLSYMDGKDIMVKTSNEIVKDRNYSLFIKNDSLGIEKGIKLNVIDNKISLIANQPIKLSDKTYTFDVQLNKPPLDEYIVSISKKSGAILSKDKLSFTRYNFNTSQKVSIDTKAFVNDTNDTISLTSRDMNKSFDIAVIIPKVQPENNETPQATNVTLVKTTSIFSEISWTTKPNYTGTFSIFIGADENGNQIIGDSNNTKYTILHQPNKEYFVNVKYHQDNGGEKIGFVKIQPTKASLVDTNKNGLSNDLEDLLKTSLNTADTNQDGILDVAQDFLLKLESKAGKTLGNYTLSSDIDGDKMGDFLELNMGRDPLTEDFNGNNQLNITISLASGASVYISNFNELKTASGVSANNGAIITGYVGDGCLINDILVANFLHKDDCKDISQEAFSIGNKTILWVAIDDFGNIQYKQQIISIFEKTNSNSGSSNVIIFTVNNIKYNIKTNIGNTVSFGTLSQSKSYTNPIVFESDTLASMFEFTNNIFDIVIQSNGGVARVVIKQPATLRANSTFVIFKNNQYYTFNTTNGDNVYSTKGNNNDCSLSDVYKESLSERDYCIKLEIQDGGLNDSDGVLNGSVSLIGGAAIIPTVVSINNSASIGCSSLHANGFSETQAKFDYLMVFSFLISFAYIIRMFAKQII